MKYVTAFKEILLDTELEVIRLLITLIVAPGIGAAIGYYFNRFQTQANAAKANAEAKKAGTEAEKIHVETEALELKLRSDTQVFYSQTISNLRVELDKHAQQIEYLTERLNTSFEEKNRLTKENLELRLTLDKQEIEIAALRSEVLELRNAQKELNNGTIIS